MYGGAGLYPSQFFDQGGPEGTVEVDATISAVSTPSVIAAVDTDED